jgi:hypothetical protein
MYPSAAFTSVGEGEGVFTVARGPLRGGATLVLVRCTDLPGDPVLALRVPPLAWAAGAPIHNVANAVAAAQRGAPWQMQRRRKDSDSDWRAR